MSKLSDSADQLLAWADRQQAIMDVAAALKEVGSLDQAISERKAATAQATIDRDAVLTQLNQAKTDLDSLIAANASEKDQHAQRLQASSAATAKEADGIIAKARADAAVLIQNARDNAAHIQANHEQTMVALNGSLDAVRAKLADTQAALEAAHTEHESVKQKTAALKAAAQDILSPK